ncbi:MAG: class I SAM-dependent DNA methyltransferase [Caulobacter sp.]|nr:class I SAM-dependent DNA methyltransferase [Caulobacter sp.]
MWPPLFEKGARICFAHRTFEWMSESKGKAAVHCVIVGIDFANGGECQMYDYEHVRGEAHLVLVPKINSYLVAGAQIYIPPRSRPPPGFRKLFQGSKPADGARLKDERGRYVTTSNLILEEEDRAALLLEEPELKAWLRPYVGGQELLSGVQRWCFWLKDAEPRELRKSAEMQRRLDRVRTGRLKSPTRSVREFAATPWLFTQDRQPDTDYLAVPEVSSETREYIPICYVDARVIGSNKLLILPEAELWLLAMLTSAMHMGWMRTIAGRMKSDYSYSPNVYNSFPWPTLTTAQKAALESAADAILQARASHPEETLASLYDPELMPEDLRAAHKANDRLVDRIYRPRGFRTERERVEHLFEMFERNAAPLAQQGGR